MRILKILDILAPSLAIGHVFGRMGCFFAGCCYGEYCDLPWAVVFDDPNSLAPLGFSLHPTQIYSSLGLLIIFLVLIKMSRLKKFEGQIFTGYLFLYSVFRFVIEYFRGDPRMMFFEGLFSIAQVISVGVALFSLIMFFYLRWQRSQFLETY